MYLCAKKFCPGFSHTCFRGGGVKYTTPHDIQGIQYAMMIRVKGACGICNWARPWSVLENNQSTNPNERDESKSSRRKLGETVGPSKSTKKQSDLACTRSPDAPLPQLLLQLGTKGHDENMDNNKDKWNKPAESDETDSTESSFFGYAE